MKKSVFFDHIEVHVDNISKYCSFLIQIFQGGRHKVISKSGTSMFQSDDGINIEVKKKKTDEPVSPSGYCNPCLRMENAQDFIENTLQFTITRTVKNPYGNCFFFDDPEGITWHIKDYVEKDEYTTF